MTCCTSAPRLAPVTDPSARLLRVLRAVVATMVVVESGSLAHEAAGGPPTQPIPLLVVGPLIGPLMWCARGSCASIPRILVTTAVGQVITHLLLEAMAPSGGGIGTAQHMHGSVLVHPLAATTYATAPATAMTGHLSSAMILSHAVATIVVTALLAAGQELMRAIPRLLSLPRLVLEDTHRSAVAERAESEPTSRSVRPLGGRAPPLRVCCALGA